MSQGLVPGGAYGPGASNCPYVSKGSYSPCASSGGGPVGRRGWPVWLQVVLGVLLAIVLLGGTVAVGPVRDKIYMRNIVHSAEANMQYRRVMKMMDPRAFTVEGVIHSYVIDDDSISHNPMGGIMVTIYANGDSQLYVGVILDKELDGHGNRQPLSGGPMGEAAKLGQLIDENEKRLSVSGN